MSEFYGKSERLLGKVLSLANTLPNAIQIDSFAAARDNEMHEATRRILSVLLRQFNLVGYCLRYTEWHVIYLLSIEIDCVLEF
ncbi:hypothetical protein JHK82_023654 [Glycine max]|uniref:Uncharacterized protein n=1 Tax=Glycine max TaxID=3847 RepID=A0A0R0I638_SOYBN|nr:hypothetical protein JHK85_024214 [Glycine max]KAG5011459.1 hypothetical protein JHK86_023720 [Glycine max]KAG5132466.1 hypothetical protein JHK82_023654 [Glycine max]